LIDEQLERWQQATLIDAATAERIRVFEAARGAPTRHRWPVLIALALGGLMLAAGVLLVVAAHWDELAPLARMGLLLGLIALFHGAGSTVAARFLPLATTLHAVGTVALGATIFLAGQTYHLEASWAQGFLLWAIGAWAGYLLLRSWPQLLFVAILTPVWLAAEWADRIESLGHASPAAPAGGLLLLSLVYLMADARGRRSADRSTLAIVGAVALIPLGVFVALLGHEPWGRNQTEVPTTVRAFWWAIAIVAPLGLAAWLRGRDAWLALLGALWVIAGVNLGPHPDAWVYLWAAAGAVGLTASGVFDGSRRRINLGMAAFALTVVVFYFSNVLDKLGRAASLLTGGALFLVLGWLLERLRRRLVHSTEGTEVA
jgi:uncharacterized membrane protein